WHRLPTPVGTASFGLAFDGARERMVLFESNGWNPVARTWERVGDVWSLRRTLTSPPSRSHFAIGYDPVRQRVVLFGGTQIYPGSAPMVALADTWEYDGVDWVQRATPASPPAQIASSMAFDYASNQLLMCGGMTASGSVAPGAWHYDGATWTHLAVATMPTGSPIASDPARQRIVAYSGYLNLTYEWDGTSWTQMSPAQSPTNHDGGRLAFVAQRGSVVLYGGYPPGGPVTDLWEYDGTTWSLIAAPPAPPTIRHVIEHDPVHGQMFVVGESTDVFMAGRLMSVQWDGTTWHADTPSNGQYARTAYWDDNRQRIVLLDGVHLEWDGARWHRGTSPPSALSPVRVVFDAARRRAVAVRSTTTTNVWMTSEWDGTNWSAPTTTTLPYFQALVYHAGRGRVMLCSLNGELWEWDGSNWSLVAPASGFPVESGVYDEASNELFTLVPVSANVWQVGTWDGAAWTQHMPATSLPPRSGYALGYDESRQRVVLFGGHNGPTGTGYLNDLWEWTGTDWAQRLPATAPEPREGAALVFDRLRRQLILLGGYRHTGAGQQVFADLWALDAAAAATVTTLGPGCGGGGNPPSLVPSAPHPGAAAFTLDLHGAPANAPCLYGLAFAGGNVPLGGTCTLFVPDQDQLVLALASGGGFASAHAAIPLALQGFRFAAQAAVLDASNGLGVSLTQGLSITVGR
ncbi:MAG TPA: hypothetical protein VFZ65_06205, partial [Planctomycetota bacterium]|nr:hypothetical protein [Planctomycetota bacterium]